MISSKRTAVPGLIVGAPASGCGKTTFTLGLLRCLARSGTPVASAKAGPDYIDTAFHAAASGRPGFNLDPWGMRPATLAAAAARLAQGAGLVVCEGVMGLFDGATADAGSTADLAAITGWPVVLVVDVWAQAASAAAVVRGFATHRPDVRIAAVVFNRVGGDAHADVLRQAVARAVPDVPVLGCLPNSPGVVLPERHLGLVQAGEHPDLEVLLERAADLVSAHADVDALCRLAAPAAAIGDAVETSVPLPPLGQRIAVAADEAFAFHYPLAVDGWRHAGAEVRFFSPLADEAPPGDADAVYLPGGYPELHAGRISASGRFLDGLRAAAERNAAVFGECGGYMVLGRGLVDGDGERHAMAGLLPLETSFADPALCLGYRRVAVSGDGPLGRTGTPFRGHQFHFARTLDEGPAVPLFHCADAAGRDLGPAGLVTGSVMGSFIHLIDGETDA